MRTLRLVLFLSAAHLILVVSTFLAFGLGLEGNRHPGHTLLWVLLQPASSFPRAPLALLPFNSAIWGVVFALLFRGCFEKKVAEPT